MLVVLVQSIPVAALAAYLYWLHVRVRTRMDLHIVRCQAEMAARIREIEHAHAEERRVMDAYAFVMAKECSVDVVQPTLEEEFERARQSIRDAEIEGGPYRGGH